MNKETKTQIPVVVEKWIVGDERRLGPTKEIFVLIPRHHFLTEDYYFCLFNKESVPQSRLFDTPQEAALAAIELNNTKIRYVERDNKTLRGWYESLEAEREAKERVEREAASAPPKEARCPVCKRTIGLRRGRFANHKWMLPRPHVGKRVPCPGSNREFVLEAKEEAKAA